MTPHSKIDMVLFKKECKYERLPTLLFCTSQQVIMKEALQADLLICRGCCQQPWDRCAEGEGTGRPVMG